MERTFPYNSFFKCIGMDVDEFMREVTGRSVHNQRIDGMFMLAVFPCTMNSHMLEEYELLQLTSDKDMYALHYVFIPRLNMQLDVF